VKLFVGYAMKPETVLIVTNLTKRFPAESYHTPIKVIPVLSNVHLTLEKGEVVALVGPNGSGKSTLLEILASILTPTSGTITYFGKNLPDHRSDVLQHIAYASSSMELPPQLTLYTYLDLHAQLYGISKNERTHYIEKYLTYFGLTALRSREPSRLSSGQKARISLIRAFLTHPKIMLLDEPTAHLDPESSQEIRAFIKDYKKEHPLSILFSSHHMDEVTDIAHRVLTMNNGMIQAQESVGRFKDINTGKRRVTIHSTQPDQLAVALAKLSLDSSRNDSQFSFEIEDNALIATLSRLIAENISYSQITIGSTTLEEYLEAVRKKS